MWALYWQQFWDQPKYANELQFRTDKITKSSWKRYVLYKWQTICSCYYLIMTATNSICRPPKNGSLVAMKCNSSSSSLDWQLFRYSRHLSAFSCFPIPSIDEKIYQSHTKVTGKIFTSNSFLQYCVNNVVSPIPSTRLKQNFVNNDAKQMKTS